MLTILESIKEFLAAKRATHNGPDLLDRWTPAMETQVNVSGEGGERMPDKRSVWRNGTETWCNIRIPKNAKLEPVFDDRPLRWSLENHVEAVGCTGWDWVAKRSRWVGFDFDAITGHAAGVGISDDALEAVKNAATAVPWVEVRKSTGGAGLHLYVYFDDEGVETANHTEHAALARTVLANLSTEANFDFAAKIDACGGIMWIWHRKMKVENEGLKVAKASTCRFVTSDLPDNWRDHVEVVTGRRTKVRIRGIDDDASFESLVSSRTIVPLEAKHKAVIDALAKTGHSTIWVPDHHLLQTHTAALASLMNDAGTGSALGLVGFFQTNSPGTDPGQPNCFAFPLTDGGWKVYRFSKGIVEADTWNQDGAGWTSCHFNEKPSLDVAAKSLGGVERPKKGGYAFTNASTAVKVAAALGQLITLEDKMLSREAILKRNTDGRLVMDLEKADSDGPLAGWDGTAKKGRWVRVFNVSADPKKNAEVVYDNLVRAIVTPAGEDAGYMVKSTAGTWDYQSSSNAKKVLQYKGCNPTQADCALGAAVSNRWELASLPFHPEYPGGRRWNLNAPQLKIQPAVLDDDQVPCHPTWDSILKHVSADLDTAVAAHSWCQKYHVTSGADWLKLWIANALRFAFEPTPYLCLYGPENSGKSILHEALDLLLTKGIARADRALTNAGQFNGELAGAVFAVVEETDVSKAGALDRLKEWVTCRNLAIRKMRTDLFQVPNTLHFIQCTNHATYCPVFPGDSRITLCHVPKLAHLIPKTKLLGMLEAEAPQFLATLMQLVLPEPDGRLRVPVIETVEKLALGDENSPVACFIRDCCAFVPGNSVAKQDVYARYCEWCMECGHQALSTTRFGRQFLELTEELVEAKGKADNRAGKRVDAYTGITLTIAA